MACIIHPSSVSNLEEVYSNKDFDEEQDDVDISKNIEKLNDERAACNQEHEENVQKNLTECDVPMSNEENCNQKNLESNETSSVLTNEIQPADVINQNEQVKKPLEKSSSFEDSNSTEINLDETSNQSSPIIDDEHCFGSSRHLEITECKTNSKDKNLRRIIDSESEEETPISKNNSFVIQTERIHNIVNSATESYRKLIDSESEGEEQNEKIDNVTSVSSKEISTNKKAKEKLVKKRKGSIRSSKDEAMRQIHSETQRLLRETEISLPYHRPKQRTLQEFLNRKKISSALPKAPSTAAKLKMSFAIVSEVLAEKEKEAELFYKSSDSEDDVQESISLVNKNTEKSITNEKEKISNIEDSDRIETSIQNNKQEIAQRDLSKDQTVESTLTNNNDNSDIELQQITNKNNQNLLESNLLEKPFDTCFENESDNISETNVNEQEITKNVIISLNNEKCVNDKISKSEINMMEDHTLQKLDERQDDEIINKEKEVEITEQSINTHEINKTLQRDNAISDTVVCSNSNDCILTLDETNKERNTHEASTIINDEIYSKNRYNSLPDECEKLNGHVQGLPLPKFADETLSNMKKLPALAINSKVTLKGSPGMIIDLTDNTKLNIKDVNNLLDRFFCKHVNKKKQSDNNAEVTVVHLQNTRNGPIPVKEVLPYKVPTSIDDPELNKPGAKLFRLKEDLKLQMTLKRNKEWKQREIELQEQEKSEKWDEEEESDLDESEKLEMHFESSNSEESEPEENDVCIKDKKRSKCLFADDEAEVTDNENSSAEEVSNESDTDDIECDKRSKSLKYKNRYKNDGSEVEIDSEEEESNDEDDDDDNAENNDDKSEKMKEKEKSLDINIENKNQFDLKSNESMDIYKRFDTEDDKKTKRLLKELQDDSNVKNSNYLQNDNDTGTGIDTSNYENNNENNFFAQRHVEVSSKSQTCKTPSMKKSMLDFVSPITQLSVLNTRLDSSEKDLSEKPEYLIDEQEFSFTENTQSNEAFKYACNIKKKPVLKKKLFDDTGESINDEYLMQLCSGKFESTSKTDHDLCLQSNAVQVSQVCQNSNKSELYLKNSSMKSVDVEESEKSKVIQDKKLILNEDSNSVDDTKENKISENLKLRIISSDDEDNEDMFIKHKKHSAKRFNLSDSEEENSQISNEENDVEDDVEDEERQYVDYDSEENEMIVIPEKNIKQVAAGFLEEEAELSESDWDSADEDEKDLDKLEFEEADDEHIDEHEMKNQLEKIHMKQMLDEDKREVRMLQELLFEDGDLHTDGMGRERKFKWRNIDKLGNDSEIPQESDENDCWVDVQEDEEEAKWSKLRHERDKFLEERMKSLNNEIEDELCDSQIFKFGLEAVRKIKNNKLEKQDISLDNVDSSENMEPIIPRNITDLLNGPNNGKKSQTIYNIIKKRSLLTRGEESLARIASLAKQGDSVSHKVNTRNFVFPHIDQNTNNTSRKENETQEDLDLPIKLRKRKMMSNVTLVSKRRRK